MTTSEYVGREVADSNVEQGERQAMELADRIRMVAAQDPHLAQDLVDQLIAKLDQATGGTFRKHLDGGNRGAVERGLGTENPAGTGILSPRTS